MSETADGCKLVLWDTPGFGNTARLIQRLKASQNPIGWLLTQVWNRFPNIAFWCSQQAVRNVQNDADVVLYLVNATADPAQEGYVGMEIEILGWIRKPVIVLLNQLGAPRPRDEEAVEEERWRLHLQGCDWVKKVLSLDAFTRCWVQEIVLLDAVADVLPSPRQEVFRRLRGGRASALLAGSREEGGRSASRGYCGHTGGREEQC